MGNRETDRWQTDGQTNRETDEQRDERTETDRWQTDRQRDGQMTDGWTEKRTDRDGDRWMDRDMNEQRRTDITRTQTQLKVFNWLCETLHRLAGRGQRDEAEAERRGRGQRDGGGGELIDRGLSSVTITGALLNKSSRHVGVVIWPIYISVVCNPVVLCEPKFQFRLTWWEVELIHTHLLHPGRHCSQDL